MFFSLGSMSRARGNNDPNSLPNILFITIDTLRPDHLGCYGYESIKTPIIDNLAQNGVLFTDTYSSAPLTLPSHVTIMTGQYPIQHGVRTNGTFILPDAADTISEILHGRGYATGAIVASAVLASHCGLRQGFDTYDDHIDKPEEGKSLESGKSFRKGDLITALAEKWLQKNHKKPFFLWVHYFDPHAPYDPPAPFNSQYQDRPYDGEIAYTDQCLGHLLEEMRKLQLRENTLIILVGDHGEGLWEHNEQAHGLFIYDTTLKVPFIMQYPKHLPEGKKFNFLVGTVDIMPTILELLGIETKNFNLPGQSLIPILTGPDKSARPTLYCESLYPQLNFNWSPLEGIITSEGWKYIHAPKPELYHLKNDLKEETNLYTKNPAKANSLHQELLSLKKDLSSSTKGLPEGAKQITLSNEIKEKLKSLGYISGTSSVKQEKGGTSISSLPDPKDKAPLLAKIDKGRELEAKGHLDQAIDMYEEVTSQDPQNIMALYWLSLAYRNKGWLPKALVEIQKVAALDPGYYDCQNILGLLYDQLAVPDKAIQAYKIALEANPSSSNIHNNLGLVYLKLNNLESAMQSFKHALAQPIDPVLASLVYTNMAEVYIRRGDLEKAEKRLTKAIRQNEYHYEAHLSLADLYFHQKKIDQCIKAWERVIMLWPDDYLAYYKLAHAFLAINQTDQAIQILKKCLQLHPDYPEARMLLQQISISK